MADKIIKRNLVLELMAIRETPDGKKHLYSIKFADKQGVIRFFPQAYTTGSGRGNDYVNRMRGVQPCCLQGNPEGHIYPVSIDRIFEFNGMKVKL